MVVFPRNTRMDDVPATGMDFLRMVAVARIISITWSFYNLAGLPRASSLRRLRFDGANDMGGVLTEEVVVKATGIAKNQSR